MTVVDSLERELAVAGVAADEVVAPVPESYRSDAWPPRQKRARSGRAGMLVRPRSTAAVSAVLRLAGEHGLTVCAYGAGSNVTGAIDTDADVVVATDALTQIVSLDRESQVVTVQAGVLGGELEVYLEREGLTLGHYPQSLLVSTVGGWVATRATGTYSAYYGGIERLVCGLTVVLADGEVLVEPVRARPAGGLDLVALVCGSEGSLGIVTEVDLAVQRRLPERVVCAAFGDLGAGLEAQRELAQAGLPLGLVRLYNHAESLAVIDADVVLRAGECLLVVTTLGPEAVAAAGEAVVRSELDGRGARALPRGAADKWFAGRYAGPGFMERRNEVRGVMFDTIEVALPWRTAQSCVERLERELAPLSDPLYCHFSHVYGAGVCLYMILHVRADDDERVLERWEAAWSAAARIVAEHQGTLAHHHGIGSVRAAAYAATDAGRLHERLARALDPRGVLAAPLLAARRSGRA